MIEKVECLMDIILHCGFQEGDIDILYSINSHVLEIGFSNFFSVYYTYWLEIEYFCGRAECTIFGKSKLRDEIVTRACSYIRAGEAALVHN